MGSIRGLGIFVEFPLLFVSGRLPSGRLHVAKNQRRKARLVRVGKSSGAEGNHHDWSCGSRVPARTAAVGKPRCVVYLAFVAAFSAALVHQTPTANRVREFFFSAACRVLLRRTRLRRFVSEAAPRECMSARSLWVLSCRKARPFCFLNYRWARLLCRGWLRAGVLNSTAWLPLSVRPLRLLSRRSSRRHADALGGRRPRQVRF